MECRVSTKATATIEIAFCKNPEFFEILMEAPRYLLLYLPVPFDLVFLRLLVLLMAMLQISSLVPNGNIYFIFHISSCL